MLNWSIIKELLIKCGNNFFSKGNIMERIKLERHLWSIFKTREKGSKEKKSCFEPGRDDGKLSQGSPKLNPRWIKRRGCCQLLITVDDESGSSWDRLDHCSLAVLRLLFKRSLWVWLVMNEHKSSWITIPFGPPILEPDL